MVIELSRVLRLMEMDLAMVKAAVKEETLNKRIEQAKARFHFYLSALLPNGSTNDDKVGHVEKKYTDQERQLSHNLSSLLIHSRSKVAEKVQQQQYTERAIEFKSNGSNATSKAREDNTTGSISGVERSSKRKEEHYT
ncbi:hypothetical protein Q3G72_018013 [Acer saccharum]|nr:hypothetical protein Q3G72_018013 [Acer saccharum]